MKDKNKETKKIICSSCGSSQVNHRLMFFLRFMDELISRIGYFSFSFLSNTRHVKFVNFIEKSLFYGLYLLKIISFSDDDSKIKNGRSKLIWDEAKKRGIEIKQLLFFRKPIDHFRAKINKKFFFFQSLPIPPWLPQRGYEWIDDKLIFAKKLQTLNFPSPKTKKIIFLKDAIKAFNDLSKPIIVKPQAGPLGRHTTTNINTKQEMINAFKLARQITVSMAAQEHLFGSVYRATVVNNTLVGFFRADPPNVIGDGVKTIKELIEEKNKNRPDRVSEILISEELINFLKRQNLTIENIVPTGVKINLLAKTGRFYGGYTKEMINEVHPKMFSIFSNLSRIIEIPVAGFDLIIEDPKEDPDTQRWGIIECNSLPFIDLHYFPLEGEPVNVAKYIWDLWDIKK